MTDGRREGGVQQNGWVHLGETWASGQVWECLNCGHEKITELIRNPDPVPDLHDCWPDGGVQ